MHYITLLLLVRIQKFWYLQLSRTGRRAQTPKLSLLLHCPSSQKTCGNSTTFQFNWLSSWDWGSRMYLFHPTFIDCYSFFSCFSIYGCYTFPRSYYFTLHAVTLCETTLFRPKSLRELQRENQLYYITICVPVLCFWMCSLLNGTFAGQGVVSK